MVKVFTCLGWFLLIFYLHYILTLQVIPERVLLTYINKKYLYNGSIYVKRHGRRSQYYLNIEATTKCTFNDNVTLNLVFLEKQQNEYKQSFVEAHLKICDMLNTKSGLGPYIASMFRNSGFYCPLPAGNVKIMNMSVPADNFPNVWPFERCKIAASLTQSPTNDFIAKADVYLYFKQSPRAV